MRNLESAIKAAELIEPTLGGRSFTLVMAHSAGNPKAKNERDYHIIPRDKLPCWGEMRKYKATHGKKYTQEDDYRPTDLYQPFPEGVPCAVVIKLKNFDRANVDVIKEYLSESPWAVTLKDDVVKVTNENIVVYAQNPHKGLRFDSTVFVNLLAALKNMNPGFYLKTREFLSPREAMFFALSQHNDATQGLGKAYEYYFAHPSAYRFLNGLPRFLSNGAFGDGFDYSRTELQEVFSSDVPEYAYHPQIYFKEKGLYSMGKDWTAQGEVTESIEKLCHHFKEGLYEALENEMKALGINEKDIAA